MPVALLFGSSAKRALHWFRRFKETRLRTLVLPNEIRMNVNEAIQNGDADVLRRLLSEDPSRANELIEWGSKKKCLTHPLHYISDMLFNGTLQRGREVPLVDALIEAGADLNFNQDGRGETPLIGAASLGAEDVGLRLLDAGAKPENRGIFGETALHWAALLGEDRLAARLIPGSELNLQDERYNSPPLGWAIHGWCNPPAGNHGRQREVIALLLKGGVRVAPTLLASDSVRGNPEIMEALRPDWKAGD